MDNLYAVALKNCSAGYTAAFVSGINQCNLTTSIIGYTGNTSTVPSSPVVMPYGFMSVPAKNFNAVIGNIGIRSQQPVVLGFTNGVEETSPLDLVAGESGLYNSTTYTLELKLAEIRARFNGLSSRFVSGEWDSKLISDIFNEFINLINLINTDVVNVFNLHTHGVIGAGTTVSTTLMGVMTVPPTITNDLGYITNQQIFMDDNSVEPPS